ncbi:MAG TPA: ABC transporter permease [Gemmatimonadaceae bacterium]|nr:ABC transporter permease [Gemmatimonadaceae bacterium]
MTFPQGTDADTGPGTRRTATFPIPQRAGIIIFRQVSRSTRGFFRSIGARTFFTREMVRAFREWRTWLPLTLGQARNIGVDSLPLVFTVSAFIGAVTAFQTFYQLFPGAQLSAVAWITRQSIVLELGPLLTALVLAGRVGARMTAEIGTMRVTEQIDALETLAYDPVAYLVVPRFVAAMLMLPLLTIIANATGIFAGYLISIAATDVTHNDFVSGLRLTFDRFQVVYGLIKATLFGAAISLIGTYEGYITEAGAEGVGRSTARTVVISSVMILLLDALTAVYLAQYLQS